MATNEGDKNIKPKQKVIYWSDELNDDFALTKTKSKKLKDNFKYTHKCWLWNFCSSLLYRFIAMPYAYLFCKLKFKTKYEGREKLKQCKKQGYFIYGNHTQGAFDAYNPNVMNSPKRTYIITSNDATSIFGLKNIICMLGAIPVPNSIATTKNFYSALQQKIERKNCICVYPEAHIWPFYTEIRPYKETSFRYPVMSNSPCYCFTTTYQSYGKSQKVKAIVYIDGPFYPDKNQSQRQQMQNLRDKVYNTMLERVKNNNIEVIKYINKNFNDQI